MLRGSYTVQPPFKIISLDQNYWEQQLESVTLVQVNDVELELYTVNKILKYLMPSPSH
jgi:sugar/nucleoside kinase (ribokinase family)